MADKRVMDDTPKAPPVERKRRAGPFTFLAQVRQEGRKVTWTTRRETLTATAMVLVMVVLAAIFFYVTDFFLGAVVRWLTGVGAN
jgi:preprotein translocase subunit SecE